MTDNAPQTYKNHARFDPWFHFVLAPATLAVFGYSVAHAIRHPNSDAIVLAIVTFLLFFTIFKTRVYSLKVQDRVIRLEERLRLSALLPAGSQPQIEDLTEKQLVALRFACDAELPALAERAAREKLSNKQIKQSIQTWRPDYWRV